MAKTATNSTGNNVAKLTAFGVMDDAFVTMLAAQMGYYENECDRIALFWHCPGGSTYAGTACYNTIKNCKVPVDVYVVGVAASMGAYAIMGATKRYISKYGRMMLHEGKFNAGGTSDELRHNADEVDAANKNMVQMTMSCTGMTEAEVKAKFFNGQDNWVDADEAVSLGLADDIFDKNEAKAKNGPVGVYAMLTDDQQSLLTKKNKIMPDFKPAKEVLAAVGLNEGATETEYNMAVLAMAKSNNDLTLQAKRDKAEAITKEVNALLTQAVAESKITPKFQGVLAVQYAENPEGLKAVLAEMMPYQSIASALNTQSPQRGGQTTYKPEVVALMAQGWDKLHKEGGLANLRATDPTAFNELYKTKYGYYPNESPVPVGVTGNLAADMQRMPGVRVGQKAGVKW